MGGYTAMVIQNALLMAGMLFLIVSGHGWWSILLLLFWLTPKS